MALEHKGYMQPDNKLQERGAVGKFHRDAGVRAGDFVILRETSPGQWHLLKRGGDAVMHDRT